MMKNILVLLFFAVNSYAQSTEDSLQFADAYKEDLFSKFIKGKPFLPFSVKAENGAEINSDMIKGKVAVINFWFEACAPCVAEFESLNKLYARYGNNPDFVFVSFTFDPDITIDAARKKYNLTYPIYHLSRDSCKQLTFDIQGYPSFYFLDRNSQIDALYIGGPIDRSKAASVFQYVYLPRIDALLKRN